MIEHKSDVLSEQFKNEGNRNYAKKLYYDALISWNKVKNKKFYFLKK